MPTSGGGEALSSATSASPAIQGSEVRPAKKPKHNHCSDRHPLLLVVAGVGVRFCCLLHHIYLWDELFPVDVRELGRRLQVRVYSSIRGR
jgi:hypothetical protein